MNEAEVTLVGSPVAGERAKLPDRRPMYGTYVTAEPLDPAKHGEALWQGFGGSPNHELWKYMRSGPFTDRPAFEAYLGEKSVSADPMYFSMVDRATGRAAGHAAYMRIDICQRVMEVGAIVFATEFQRTRGATEAMYLMARRAFEELGYRRYEWKCNVLNDASQCAARRLGFAFEGVFRENPSRDTAWYAMLDTEWPARKSEFERWLAAENFDYSGRQKTRLHHV